MTALNTSFSVSIRDEPRLYLIGFLMVFSLSFLPLPSRAEPAQTLKELYERLSQCLKPTHQSATSDLTLLFSLKRDGSLLGKPRITHSNLGGSQLDQEVFVSDVLSDLAHCLPIKLSDGLGAAVAGRPLYFHVRTLAPSRGA